MKKIYIALISLFWAVIIFFTFFGEKLYMSTNPNVTVTAANTMQVINDETFVLIPSLCLFDENYVYVVTTQKGFSIDISTIEKREVATKPSEIDNRLLVTEGISRGEVIVSKSDRPLADGMRVVIS